MDEWWSITTPDYISANHIPWTVKEKSIEEARISLVSNEIYFVSFSFCQNVIIYIIVYANHSLSPPKLSKFCLDLFLSWLRPHNGPAERKEWCPLFWSRDICFHCFCLLSASAKTELNPHLNHSLHSYLDWRRDDNQTSNYVNVVYTLKYNGIVILLAFIAMFRQKAYDMRRFSHQSPVCNVSSK